MNHIPESIAMVVIAAMSCYVARDYLQAFKRRNELLDKFQRFERQVEERLLSCESRIAPFENLLGAHERLVERVSALDANTKKALSDLASKWLAEVGKIQDTQSAAFSTGMAAPMPKRRFTP